MREGDGMAGEGVGLRGGVRGGASGAPELAQGGDPGLLEVEVVERVHERAALRDGGASIE
jgi:hypothetical protein